MMMTAHAAASCVVRASSFAVGAFLELSPSTLYTRTLVAAFSFACTFSSTVHVPCVPLTWAMHLRRSRAPRIGGGDLVRAISSVTLNYRFSSSARLRSPRHFVSCDRLVSSPLLSSCVPRFLCSSICLRRRLLLCLPPLAFTVTSTSPSRIPLVR